jgi:hypothetical protein
MNKDATDKPTSDATAILSSTVSNSLTGNTAVSPGASANATANQNQGNGALQSNGIGANIAANDKNQQALDSRKIGSFPSDVSTIKQIFSVKSKT